MKRVGHKGAHHIAPGNTLASFDAALAAGVDMVEFDVLPAKPSDPDRSRLLLAHDPHDAERPDVLELAEGLDHLCGEGYRDIELDVDLKTTGYEERVIAALRSRGLLDRALISTMERDSIARIRAIDESIRVGLSIPRLRRDPRDSRWTRYPTYAAVAAARRLVPGRMARALAAGEFDAVMAHDALVTPRLVSAVQGAGGELYVWTVDSAERIAALEAMGVDGVITNDPRLFAR